MRRTLSAISDASHPTKNGNLRAAAFTYRPFAVSGFGNSACDSRRWKRQPRTPLPLRMGSWHPGTMSPPRCSFRVQTDRRTLLQGRSLVPDPEKRTNCAGTQSCHRYPASRQSDFQRCWRLVTYNCGPFAQAGQFLIGLSERTKSVYSARTFNIYCIVNASCGMRKA